ncbi:replication-associated recombination protein A [Alicyclobacillus cycloheptanicus]|uniref:ATPase n=1 Tax=Alicyclobacillus cycloheptanicus TaxID=1457 RepID=A0ABT9XJP0_9BACL|nr:replication-associated recombination protein A [Alicyclobacillus cycloheptanicus]MDQ0190522.1 putative ATPase [Alicyclobacillus cycloheptanicus]WDM00719.1 replication-associated recombination protein A [Alicyclobacillus cycloheptanicus]
MDLFSAAAERDREQDAPLAYRMRPRTLDEVVGQQAVVGPGTLLRRAIEADRLVSVIFFGPPGSGKTTLAHIIANATSARFETLNAVSAGVADIRRVIQEASDERKLYGRKTVLFIDEIHRFNKAQQDALLPYVEGGLVVLIGATTENPYFEVNSALVSRSHVFRLEPLTDDDLRQLLQRALTDEERGLGRLHATLSPEAATVLVQYAAGDARRALNALELAAVSAPLGPDGYPVIDVEQARQSIQSRQVLYDKSGDEHYDTISAFIKSVRGSDPDAALLWLAKMIAGGEDPKFIARRLIILAAEDIGNADPHGLPLAVAALHAVEAIGMPEGRIPLAQATTYLATAPKSNAAYMGINQALADVEQGLKLRVPAHLRGTGYQGAKALGSGEGYLYPHDYPGHVVEQNYWPEGVSPRSYYRPDVPRERR